MFNIFSKNIKSKIDKFYNLNQDLTGIIAERDLMIDNYNQISKAISSFDFDNKGVFKEQKYYDDKYVKDLANFKSQQQSLNKKISRIKDDIVKAVRRESGLLGLPKLIVKSLYKDGKIGLEEYEKNVSSKTKRGQTKYSDCIVLNNKNEILLLKRSMWEDNHKGAWVIPGGHVDKGEDFETAGKRELFEESGISLDKIISNYPDLNLHWEQVGIYEDNNALIHYFCLRGIDSECVEILLDDAETRDYKWVDIEELDNYEMIFNMKENIMKIMGWDNYPQVKLIRKAIQMNIIPIERINEINKAMSHKYIRKESDGKGGWNYIYEEKKEENGKKEDKMVDNEKKEEGDKNILEDLDNLKLELIAKVEPLVKLKKKLYSNMDVESPKSEDEKKLEKEISDIFSNINSIILHKRKIIKDKQIEEDKYSKKEDTDKKEDIKKDNRKEKDINKSQSDTIRGGKADGKTLKDIAKKHNISLEEIEKQYKLGIKIEREHTDDEEQAGEITKDHLWENDKYYIDTKPKDWAEKELKAEEIEKAFVNISELFIKGDIDEDIYNVAKEKYDIYKSKKDFEESIYKKENND